MAGFANVRSDVYDRVSRSQYYRDNLAGLTAHQRHQRLLAELGKGGQEQQADATAALASTVTDEDVLRQHHRFLRTAADDEHDDPADWGVRLAKRYYARLFKEYAIADLSRYKESKVGMRWRTKPEVVSGKGQFVCGAKGCNETAGLASYEVNFSYAEAGQHKQALVKLRLCEACAAKLNHRKEKQYKRVQQPVEEQQQQRKEKQQGEEHSSHKRKQKHRQKRKDRDRDTRDSHSGSDSETSDSQHAPQHRKRRRHSYEGSARQQGSEPSAVQQQRERLFSSPQLGGVGGRKQQGSDAGLTDVEIEAWLDSMFAAA